MTEKFDLLIFIGRFQPFHNGHKKVVETALNLSKNVLILIGSSYEPPSLRNPFSYSERSEMIHSVFPHEYIKNVYGSHIMTYPILDYPYSDTRWTEEVQTTVKNHLSYLKKDNKKFKIGLIGYAKDHTSYYLKLFPQWESINVEMKIPLSSTELRPNIFSKDYKLFQKKVAPNIPFEVLTFLEKWCSESKTFDLLCNEMEHIEKYKQQWKNVPYPVIFTTVDTVVIQSGHVLLIKRKSFPGKGLLALPGGFLNVNERIIDGAIRELQEETKIDVPEKVLRGSIKANKVFDAINRSSRGRTITHAFLIELESNNKLPKIKGSDDAEKALWVPIGNIHAYDLFEDHYHIIQNLIGMSTKG